MTHMTEILLLRRKTKIIQPVNRPFLFFMLDKILQVNFSIFLHYIYRRKYIWKNVVERRVAASLQGLGEGYTPDTWTF